MIGVALEFRLDEGERLLVCDDERNVRVIEDYESLPPGLWLTALSVTDFFMLSSQTRAHLRHREFLGLDLDYVLAHFLLAPLSEVRMPAEAERCARLLCRVLKKVLLLGRRAFGSLNLDADYLYESIQDQLFPDSFDEDGQSLGELGLDLLQSQSELLLADKMGFVTNSGAIVSEFAVGEAPNEESGSVVLRAALKSTGLIDEVNRLLVPFGHWVESPVTAFGNNVVSQVRTLSLLPQPVLAQVRVVDVHEQLAVVTRNALRPGARRWISHQELIFLRKFATVIPERVLLAERYVVHASLLPFVIDTVPCEWTASITAQLLETSYVRALHHPSSQSGMHLCTSRNAWLGAHLRLKTLTQYLGADLGTINGFGTLELSISCAAHDATRIAARAVSAGFVLAKHVSHRPRLS